MNIYVGNLAFSVTESDLKDTFAAFGAVQTASVIKDKFSGESRGFGFVEMPNKDEAERAISSLNGKDLKGRALTVNEAKPRTDRPRSGGGGGGFGGGSGRVSGGFGGGGVRLYYAFSPVFRQPEGGVHSNRPLSIYRPPARRSTPG